MARTIVAIKKDITDAFITNVNVISFYALNPALSFEEQFSSVSLESLIFDSIAFCVWVLENLFDTHQSETKELIAAQKAARPRWYAEMAKKFQFGDSLVTEQDYYDNTGISAAVVDAKKVVKYASATDTGSGIRLKIAGMSGGVLAPITTTQLSALQSYMNQIKWAGTFISYVNSSADSLKMTWKIYYNPLVLDATGKRLDGTNDTPIQSVIADYLTNGIEFDGFFNLAELTDRLQKVDGVTVPSLEIAQARYGLLPYSNIVDFYQPDAGYLVLSPSDLTLIFISSPI